MPVVEITYSRALRIWWSFAWRACVLLLPVMLILDIVLVLIMPLAKLGQPPDPHHIPGFMLRIFAVWATVMAANILLQAQAMRWMLKTRWAGFRLEAISER